MSRASLNYNKTTINCVEKRPSFELHTPGSTKLNHERRAITVGRKFKTSKKEELMQLFCCGKRDVDNYYGSQE